MDRVQCVGVSRRQAIAWVEQARRTEFAMFLRLEVGL